MKDTSPTSRTASRYLPLLTALSFPLLFSSCKDNNVQVKGEADVLREKVSFPEVNKLELWQDSLLETAKSLTSMQFAEYTVRVQSKQSRPADRSALAVSLNVALDKELVFDLLHTTEVSAYRFKPLVNALDIKPDPSATLDSIDSKFTALVESNYRNRLTSPDLAKLLYNITGKDKIDCTDCALTYLATYSAVASAAGLDISKQSIQIQAGIYVDSNDAIAKYGVGRMWLVIDGKLFDPAAEPKTTISDPDSGRYIPIVGVNVKNNADTKTFKTEPVIFVRMPEH